ncbi:MAG: glutamine--fructose-6-phosphate transaminase (isomerizing), partial [Bacteroidota bacterium]
MCGIVGYIGYREAFPILIKGLKRLEYRGYDSAGVALLNGHLQIHKKQGKVSALEESISEEPMKTTVGIGHTRWATHGEPNDENAHPHFSDSKDYAIIHNGIIENYGSLKKELEKKGYKFRSDTDTEVLVTFIEDIVKEYDCSLEEGVRIALSKVVGAYAIVVMSAKDETKLVAARKGSPLVIGVGQGEYFLASDATPIIEYTNEVVYLNDEEVAVLSRDGLEIKDFEALTQTPYIHTLDLALESIEKSGYEHFMLKEIFEQPNSIADCMRGRLKAAEGHLVLGGIRDYANALVNADKIIFVACGTSWHSCLVAEYIIEELCRIPVEVEYASEFRYRNPIINEGDVVFAVSQSGETADTLAAMELAKSKGAILFGIVNVVGSSIARTSHEGAYLHAGPEIGVASTKAFTAQLVVLTMIALKMAYLRGTIAERRFHELLVDLERIPQKVAEVLKQAKKVEEIAYLFKDAHNFLYLGRGLNFPVALEGARQCQFHLCGATAADGAPLPHGDPCIVGIGTSDYASD